MKPIDILLKNKDLVLPKNKVIPHKDIVKFMIVLGMDRELEIYNKNPPKKEFKSDGASCFPDKIGKVDIYLAALIHDISYWLGGTKEDRLIADYNLGINVIKCGGSIVLSQTMFEGVRFGGTKYLPTPWKWGYGQ